MSEPYSFVLACQTQGEAIHTFLNKPLAPPDTFHDWPKLDIEIASDDWEDAFIATSGNASQFLADLRDAAMENLSWRFRFDPGSGQLNIVSAYWTENWSEMLAGIAVMRQIARHAQGGGYMLAHGFGLRLGQTAFAMSFADGEAHFVGQAQIRPLIEHAAPLVNYVLDKAAAAQAADLPAEEVCRDELDQFATT